MNVVAMLLVVGSMLLSVSGHAAIDSKAEMREGTVICAAKQAKEDAKQHRDVSEAAEKAVDAR